MENAPIPATGAPPATTVFQQALSSQSRQQLALLLERAERALCANDSGEAHRLYVSATELDPNHRVAWKGRAASASELSDAITSWACALALEPTDSQARAELARNVQVQATRDGPGQIADCITLGRTLAKMGQKSLAHDLLKRATELDDKNEAAWVWRAGVADDPKESVVCLNQALALNPQNAQAQAGLAWAMSLENKKVRPASTIAAEEAGRLVQEGQRALESSNRSRAHQLFQRATELDQKNESAWLWRGGTTSDVDEALTCMEQALALNPENQAAREARSWLRVKKLRQHVGEQVQATSTVVRPANDIRPVTDGKGRAALVFVLVVALFSFVAIYFVVLR